MTRAEIESLYKRYAPAVLRRAKALLGDAAMAQDAVHEVFSVLVRGEDRFRGEASALTWLYQATTHKCLNTLRDASTRARLLEGRPSAEAAPADPEHPVLIRELLGRVPAELAEIAVYSWVDQMDQEEIATLLGVSRRTIGNRLEEFKRLAAGAA